MFNHPSTEDHLSCFQLSAVMIKAVINLYVQWHCAHYSSFLLHPDKHLESCYFFFKLKSLDRFIVIVHFKFAFSSIETNDVEHLLMCLCDRI